MERLTDNRFLKDGFYQPKCKDEEKEIRSMGNDLTFEKLYKHCAEVEKENAELQKQVDELTAFKNEAISTSLYGIGRKDGKAVANAIWIDITSHYIALRVLGNATIELDKLAEFWHKYGVEVE